MQQKQVQEKPTIAAFIKNWRIEKSYTQIQLALKLGVDKTTISAWERSVRFPKEQHLQLISDLSGISVDLLYKISKERKMAG